MREESRFVRGDFGAQCVMTSGTTAMLRWCVDNLDTMEVSVINKSLGNLLLA